MQNAKKQEIKARVINIMADGHIEDDLTGHMIPITPDTELAYRTMAQVALRRAQEIAQKST